MDSEPKQGVSSPLYGETSSIRPSVVPFISRPSTLNSPTLDGSTRPPIDHPISTSRVFSKSPMVA